MSSSPSKVYIIILNYNGWKDTLECLESLLQLTYRNYQIIVVDNDSPNDSFTFLINWAEQYFRTRSGGFAVVAEAVEPFPCTAQEAAVLFIRAKRNGGFAAGNNIGIRLALLQSDFDYIWLLNNDTTVATDSLTKLVQKAQEAKDQNQKVGIWGSKILYFHQPDTLQAVGGKFSLFSFTSSHIGENQKDTGQYDQSGLSQDYVVGASMFVSSNFIKEVGLLDENYFLYFEELDWASRAKLKHFKLGYNFLSRVYHKEGKSIGSSSDGGKKSKLADYHGIRSKIIFVRKFYPGRILQLYTILAASVLLRIGRLQLKRARQILLLMLNSN